MARERLGQFNINQILKDIGISSRASVDKGLSGIRDVVEDETARRLDALKAKAEEKRTKTPWWQRMMVSMIPGVGPYAALIMAIQEKKQQKEFRERQKKAIEKMEGAGGIATGTFMEGPQSSILGGASKEYGDWIQSAMDAENTLGWTDIGLSALPVAGKLTKLIPGAQDIIKAGLQGVSKVPFAGQGVKLAGGLTQQFKTPAIAGKFATPGAFIPGAGKAAFTSYSLPSIALPSLWQSAGQAAQPTLSDMLIGDISEPQFVGTKAPKMSRRRRGQVY